MQASTFKLQELQAIITKMSLEACCIAVIPMFGVKWRDVSQAVRNARLPMIPSSVARVLCRHAAKSLPQDELEDILGQLRLKLVATQARTWHVVHLQERTVEEPVAVALRTLAHRVLTSLKNGKHRNMTPEVQSVIIEDLMYFSIQFVSEMKESSILYMCTPPGEPVALFTSVASAGLMKACVEGLGFKRYEIAQLHGKDIPSLLRIADPAWAANAEYLAHPPEYNPTPTVLTNGIDYTNKTYDQIYVDNLLGPNPPLLTDLNIKSTRMFFDKSRLEKNINLSVSLKSEDVSKTLKSWVAKGALAATSDFFQIFHQIKSNRIQYNKDDSE